MKIGLMLGYSGKHLHIPMDMILQAEELGYDAVWTAEAYGSDAVSPAAWILAGTRRIKVGTCIMQMSARTPAMTAMTALTLSELSGNRFILGLGASGPQVVEGWHGVPYGKPLTRTREYIGILRRIMAREGPVEHQGTYYHMPNREEGTTGLGKPLKSILGANTDIPIYTASITPAGLACAAEVADGVFPIFMSPEKFSVIGDHLQTGFDRAAQPKSLDDFTVAPNIPVVLGDDVAACRAPLRDYLALYIGGMGAKNQNFYTRYASSLGYEEEAERIQSLYLAGDKQGAAAAVPDALIDEIALVGPAERIRERASAWRSAASRGEVDSVLFGVMQVEALPLLADVFL